MSEADDSAAFAPPPFDAEAALVQLRRSLRELKLTERSSGFELRGKRVIEVMLADGSVSVRLARRLMNTPEWDPQTIRSGADQRKLLDEVRRRLERWLRED
jgi:hypothetical protein